MSHGPGPFFRVLAMLALWHLAGSAMSAADTPTNDVLLGSISKVLSSADTVFAQFEQERNVSLFTEPLKSDGYLCFAAPGSIRWEISRPYRSILLSGDRGVAQFEWMDGRWQKLNAGLEAVMRQITGQIVMILRGQFTGSRDSEYEVSVATADETVVTLVPKKKEQAGVLSSISAHMSLDLSELKSVRLMEPDGDSTVIRFRAMKTNVTFAAGVFDTRAPADIETVLRDVAAPAPAATSVHQLRP